jgi:hypothetical protein
MKASEQHRGWDGVFKAELEEIGQRPESRPEEGLIGLAISGGGIRSATFGLGVLETLRELGLLKQLHYLSTVSGGGYIGAWLSAACRRKPTWLDPATDWRESIAHLRRYSNYLSPRVGFFSADTWSMLTIWLRNTLLVQVTVILGLACALLAPRPLFELFQRWPGSGNWRWVTILLFILGLVGIAGNQLRVTSRNDVPWLKAEKWKVGLVVGLLAVAAAWFYGTSVGFEPFKGGEVFYRQTIPIALFVVIGGFFLQPVAVRAIGALPVWGNDPPQEINYTQNWVQGAVIIPLMTVAFLVAAILWGEAIGQPGVTPWLQPLEGYGSIFQQSWRYWPFPLSVVFVSFWLLSLCAIHDRRQWTGWAAALLSPVVAVLVLHALLAAIALLMQQWAADPVGGAFKAFVWGPPVVALAFVLSIVALIGMMSRESSDGVREWWSRLGAWLWIYATAWMVMAVSAVYGPMAVDWAVAQHPWTALTAGGGWVGTVIAGLFAGNSESTGGEAKGSMAKAKEVVARVAPFVFIAGLLIGVSYILRAIVLANTANADWATLADAKNHEEFLTISLLLLAGCVVAVLLMALRVDINEFSLNAFYRNRLVRCYLGATRFAPFDQRTPQNFTGFDDKDDMPMAELAATTGPLHIVNCALNLGGSSDLALHTRQSAAFTLTPFFCGSAYVSRNQQGDEQELGYVPTQVYGGESGAPTLGQAISVSGAAASPNMGYHTSPVTAFLLTLFNVRLGWWFPNPMKSASKAPSPHFNLTYLLAELFGGASDKSTFVSISDGGHFENLAAYELVRRKCRVIIISDGECDPTPTFEGLGTLIRMCEVDFNVRITVDVSDIRLKGTPGWSTQRWAIGCIKYGGNTPDGILIYLKASMTGKEDTQVLQYKSSHPTFPHETTGDQFYGEDQFESYRNLGKAIALEALGPHQGAPADLRTLAKTLLSTHGGAACV